jgi:hypothetical protein
MGSHRRPESAFVIILISDLLKWTSIVLQCRRTAEKRLKHFCKKTKIQKTFFFFFDTFILKFGGFC